MQQCQDEVWTPTVCQSLSIRTLLVWRVFMTCWFLNNSKTASPLPHRLHRRSVPKRAIKKGMTGARVSSRQPSLSGRLIGLGWSSGPLRAEHDDHQHPGLEIQLEAMFCKFWNLSMRGLEELQEEGAVEGQSRGPCAQKCTRDEECLLSTLGT